MTTPRKALSRTATQKARRPRIALALAGGGPLGAIYELGALCALDEALEGLDLNDCEHYVGVSAGGFIAAGLANGMRPLARAGWEKVKAGHTTLDELVRNLSSNE